MAPQPARRQAERRRVQPRNHARCNRISGNRQARPASEGWSPLRSQDELSLLGELSHRLGIGAVADQTGDPQVPPQSPAEFETRNVRQAVPFQIASTTQVRARLVACRPQRHGARSDASRPLTIEVQCAPRERHATCAVQDHVRDEDVLVEAPGETGRSPATPDGSASPKR